MRLLPRESCRLAGESRPMLRFRSLLEVILVAAFVAMVDSPALRADDVQFNRDIRPILSDICYQCHGPDKNQRKADLRLDTETGAFADLGGRKALVPGKRDDSELWLHITSNDPAEQMPPPKSGRKLTKEQIALIGVWIDQGAKWQKHWSFLPPVRPTPPNLTSNWPRNSIDQFILDRLHKENLSPPSPEADKTTLIRRVSFDLTGLPPTPADVDAFVSDKSPDAYEKVVDRLLSSPRYGERMAVRWLDGARYADTSGYQSDGERFMWRWRDWVIEAYNRNQPFDQFTIEQLAGDMLPGATLDQKIASGFNRNHRANSEGGIVPEEYAVEYVVDRVETTSTVWLGLTLGCTRCHDHKFDPVLQKEFYGLFAYFNNIPEFGRASKFGNSPPYIKAPTREQEAHLKALETKLAAAESSYGKLLAVDPDPQAAWEKAVDRAALPDWTVTRGLQLRFALDGDLKVIAEPGSTSTPSPPVSTGSTVGATPREKPVPQFDDGSPAFAAGRLSQAADFDGSRFITAGEYAGFGYLDKFSLAAWIKPRGDRGGTIISKMSDVEEGDGYSLLFINGKLQVNLVKRWLDDALRVETKQPLPSDEWSHVLVTYDGSRNATGVKIYVNGRPQELKVNLDLLNQTFVTKEPVRIGAGNGPQNRFHGLIDDVRIFNTALAEEEAVIVAVPETVAEIAAIPSEKRNLFQQSKLRTYFLEAHAPDVYRKARQDVQTLRRERDEYVENLPTTMVMEEMPVPRPTHLLFRGEYDKPQEKVDAGIPGCVKSMQQPAPRNRLDLARWVASRENPLTARVAVNRLWQMAFGTGLVKTVDDFGSQGEWPSHPELLDWLAVEFMEPSAAGQGGWDVKRMLKLIVTSATYRQSSKATTELRQRDPENRLLARGPRMRLSPEMVRDQALFASGLLVEKLGGSSVKPYQPDGLWNELADADYVQDHGEKLYRRSMYTFWKRTVPPPTMITFDAAGRETCIVRETRTNTPLQALTLMNETAFVEAARMLGARIIKEGGPSSADRIALAFRLVTSRKPRDAELRILTTGFEQHLARYRKDSEAAKKLIAIGESPVDEKIDPAELAAYTAVSALVLNLDEAITKE